MKLSQSGANVERRDRAVAEAAAIASSSWESARRSKSVAAVSGLAACRIGDLTLFTSHSDLSLSDRIYRHSLLVSFPFKFKFLL
jgi:hypothetical protein